MPRAETEPHLRLVRLVEVLREGKKAIGWEKRNAEPGGSPGRFKRGIGMALSSTMPDASATTKARSGFEKAHGGNRASGDGGGAGGGEGGASAG